MLDRVFKRPWLKWLMALALWTMIGIAFAGQLYLSRSNIGFPVTWAFAMSRALADWYVFALLSIPAFWLARRFHIARVGWYRNLLVHLGASALFSLAWMFLRAWMEEWLTRGSSDPTTFSAAFSHALMATFSFNLLIYWVIVSVSHAIGYYRKFHERELRTSELEKRLAQAKLQALQMQLNPHFLFNTLHAISSLMHQDVEAADRMIAHLSDLLRSALENVATQEVQLRQELAFLDSYLEIERTRFGERLTLRKEIDPATLDGLVPNLLLQPLMENAIQHGIEPHARPGIIELRACREHGMLHLQVRDNGSGIQTAQALQEGIGLSNTRARLQQLYGDAHRLTLANGPDGGLEVTVRIPWRTMTGESQQEAASEKEKAATSGWLREAGRQEFS
jgi:two-component system, LytTR family, sensor kinase